MPRLHGTSQDFKPSSLCSQACPPNHGTGKDEFFSRADSPPPPAQMSPTLAQLHPAGSLLSGAFSQGSQPQNPHRPWGPAGPWSIKHRSRAWCPSSEGCLLRPQAIAIPISRCPFCRGENGGSSTLGERGSELCPSSSRAVFSNTTQAGSARGHSPRPTYQLHRQQTEPCQGQAQGRSA